ncbi:MAG: type II toxin-antitoxin system RelE/ParE family toxin [Magnetococcales bacterium]|nr:type II toxin-antitoxin system RelE/ParE family toxin [Magnetococcales bacterium]
MKEYIAKDNPKFATKVVQHIYDTAENLSKFPYSGQHGRVDETRELKTSKFSYTIVYSIEANSIRIHRNLHTRRQYPPSKPKV